MDACAASAASPPATWGVVATGSAAYDVRMRIAEGMSLPDFAVADLAGNQVTPASLRGRRVWLILTRFAACPFCSLRLHEVIELHDEIANAGVDVVVVFPSAERRVRLFVEKYGTRFRVIADPDKRVFDALGSEKSWLGQLRASFHVVKTMKAMAASKMSMFGVDDAMHRMPSDFLINADGTVAEAHYGESVDDGIEVRKVLAWASGG